jgi:ankyrin repeat protein
VAQLLAAGASVRAANVAGATTLLDAATCGQDSVVQQLLAAGSDANAADKWGQTPLWMAAKAGHRWCSACWLPAAM